MAVVLPRELVKEILTLALDGDWDDLLFAKMTRLLCTEDPECPWRDVPHYVERPMTVSFTLQSDSWRSLDQLGSIVAFKEMVLLDRRYTELAFRLVGGEVSEWTDLAIRPFGRRKFCYFFPIFAFGRRPLESIPSDRYTVQLKWKHAKAVSIGNYLSHYITHRPMEICIHSFGTQHVCRVTSLCSQFYNSLRLPYILPNSVYSLKNFGMDRYFTCTEIRYWDVSNVQDFTNFLNGARSFRADLSRYNPLHEPVWTGAFEECDLRAYPAKYVRRVHRSRDVRKACQVHSGIANALIMTVMLYVASYIGPLFWNNIVLVLFGWSDGSYIPMSYVGSLLGVTDVTVPAFMVEAAVVACIYFTLLFLFNLQGDV